MEKVVYNQLAQVRLNDNKYLVISNCSKGGYTFGQKLVVKDGNNSVDMFLKGAIHINDDEALMEIRDKIDEILKK